MDSKIVLFVGDTIILGIKRQCDQLQYKVGNVLNKLQTV
jgi:hypothetical protein